MNYDDNLLYGFKIKFEYKDNKVCWIYFKNIIYYLSVYIINKVFFNKELKFLLDKE